MNQAKVLTRPSDGERFTLNDDGLTYSLERTKQQFPGNIAGKWTVEQLVAAGMIKDKH